MSIIKDAVDLAVSGDDPHAALRRRLIASILTREARAKKEKKDGPHSYSSTQFNIDAAGYSRSQGSPLAKLQDMAAAIPDEDLAADGRETNAHITVKYGLHTQDPEEVRRVVSGFGPVDVTLGKTSIFAANESSAQRGGDQFDVVKVDVSGERLMALNKLLCDSLECTDTHPEYHPHITLAYIKAGLGEQYVGNNAVEGMELNLVDLVFSDKHGNETVISLLGPINKIRKFYQPQIEKCGGEGSGVPGPCPKGEPEDESTSEKNTVGEQGKWKTGKGTIKDYDDAVDKEIESILEGKDATNAEFKMAATQAIKKHGEWVSTVDQDSKEIGKNVQSVAEQYGSPQEANHGHCDEIAEEVVDKLEDRFRGIKIAWGAAPGESDEGEFHAYVSYNGKFYDAENPTGVDNPEELNFFKRNGGLQVENEVKSYRPRFFKCGGVGSGVPGPCPENKPEDATAASELVGGDEEHPLIAAARKILDDAEQRQQDINDSEPDETEVSDEPDPPVELEDRQNIQEWTRIMGDDKLPAPEFDAEGNPTADSTEARREWMDEAIKLVEEDYNYVIADERAEYQEAYADWEKENAAHDEWQEKHDEWESDVAEADEALIAAQEALEQAEQQVEAEEEEKEQQKIREEHQAWKKRQAKRDKKREALEAKMAALQEAMDALDEEDGDDSEPDEPEEKSYAPAVRKFYRAVPRTTRIGGVKVLNVPVVKQLGKHDSGMAALAGVASYFKVGVIKCGGKGGKPGPCATDVSVGESERQTGDVGLRSIPISSLKFPGGLLPEVSPLQSNKDKPIVVAKVGDKFKIIDGVGRASGLKNAGKNDIAAIVVSADDLDRNRGRQGDDPTWVGWIHYKYAPSSKLASHPDEEAEGYLDEFNDGETDHQDVADANEALEFDSEWRIVSDGEGGWTVEPASLRPPSKKETVSKSIVPTVGGSSAISVARTEADAAEELPIVADILLALFGEDAVDCFPPVVGIVKEQCRDDRGRFASCGAGGGFTPAERTERAAKRLVKAADMVGKAKQGKLSEAQMGDLGDHLLTMPKSELETLIQRTGLKLPKGKFAEAKADLIARMGQRIRMSSDAEQAIAAKRDNDKKRAVTPKTVDVTHTPAQGPTPGIDDSDTIPGNSLDSNKNVSDTSAGNKGTAGESKMSTPKTHSVGPKYAPFGVKVGDKIQVSSRGKAGWVAKLGGKDAKYGRKRDFLSKTVERSGMRGQIVTYTFEIDEPGEYEVGGDEFGSFKHTFAVT